MDFKHTNLAAETKYPKLVRDNIPEIIKRNEGVEPPTRVLNDDNEFLEYLFKKMLEEATELQHSIEEGNTDEELADIFELADAIIKLKGWTKEDIVAIQNHKRGKNGGFDKRIVLLNGEMGQIWRMNLE